MYLNNLELTRTKDLKSVLQVSIVEVYLQQKILKSFISTDPLSRSLIRINDL